MRLKVSVVAHVSPPASEGGVSPPSSSSHRDGAGTRRRDGCATGLTDRFNRTGSGGVALAKLETDLARFIHDQPGRKRAAGLGNEFLQQIRLALGQQLGHLLAFDGPLQNGFARLEFARLFVRLRLLAEVIRLALEHPAAAAGTFADRLLAGEIELGLRLLLCVVSGLSLALLELEPDLAVLAEHEKRLEGAAVAFRDEFIQQIGPAAGQQLLNLRGGKRLLKDDRSHPEIAFAFLADRL